MLSPKVSLSTILREESLRVGLNTVSRVSRGWIKPFSRSLKVDACFTQCSAFFLSIGLMSQCQKAEYQKWFSFRLNLFGLLSFGPCTLLPFVFRPLVFGLLVFGLLVFGLLVFGLLVFGLLVLGLLVFGLLVFSLLVFGLCPKVDYEHDVNLGKLGHNIKGRSLYEWK
jgi:hypothetical protein